jgi:hypothetical protein
VTQVLLAVLDVVDDTKLISKVRFAVIDTNYNGL